MIPTHQGRAAERILFHVMCKKGMLCRTTLTLTQLARMWSLSGARLSICRLPEARHPEWRLPFKGNMDVAALEELIVRVGRERIPLVMLTVTNNSGGGQPVSMENAKAVADVCHRHGIPLYFDACRFAENAYFIKLREAGYESKTPKQIAQEMFSLGDGCTMSAKKDGMANIGGFLCTNDDILARQQQDLLILTEGYPTYGGLAGRELKLSRLVCRSRWKKIIFAIDWHRLHTWATTSPSAECPSCSHPVAMRFTSMRKHFCRTFLRISFRVVALAAELYLEGGIRSVEIGSLMFAARQKWNWCGWRFPVAYTHKAILITWLRLS